MSLGPTTVSGLAKFNSSVVWQTVLHLSSGKLVPFSFLHAGRLVFFIQFTICLLTVQSKLTPYNGILRETLITLLGIFGSGSSSVRPHVRFTSLQAKIFAISRFFCLSVYGYICFLCPFTYSSPGARYISVFSLSRYSVLFYFLAVLLSLLSVLPPLVLPRAFCLSILRST